MGLRILRLVIGLALAATGLLAADIDGIWVGQQPGRRGDTEDVAFRFQSKGQSVTGKMFGDEFDLPLSEGNFSGDQLRFVVTTTNYYNGTKTRFVYTGAIKDGVLELVRERVQDPGDQTAPAANRLPGKQTLKLKRIN
jgi:hypothetical protein